MKFTIIVYLLLTSLCVFAQKKVKPFYNLYDFTHAAVNKNSIYSLPENINGGGVFIAKSKDNCIIDSGIVFPTSDPDLVLVRKLNDAHIVYMNWYGIKDSTQNFMPSFKNAVRYLNMIGGGTIIFSEGTYLADPYFTIDGNNITVKGAGINKTFIKVSDKAAAGLMINSNYRDAGWLVNADDLITFKDDGLPQGQQYIDLKIKSYAGKLKPGTIIFINGGANYFDQNYGEFNMIDHCTADGRVYLKYKLSRSYAASISSWAATLTESFKPPAEGSSGIINFGGTQPRGGTSISIGNDLYKVVSSTTSSAVVINTKNKGNSTSLFPAGTHLFKYRAIVLTPGVVYNVSVSDMTVTGKRKALTVSNTFKTSFNNMRFNWLPQPANPGGIWLDGDDGRDFKMTNCEINCPHYFSSQFARSFADIYIDHTKFKQAAIQFSEYNINANVSDCQFYFSYNGLPGEAMQPAILLGNTCNSINFTNNTIDASNINNLFYSGEIQGTKAVINSTVNISNNIIKCNNIASVFVGSYSGILNILNNTISGKANFLFGETAHPPVKYPTLYKGKTTTATCLIMNNTFTGYIDGFGGAADYVQYIGNTVKRLGVANASNEFNVWGNILYTHFKGDTAVNNFVCKDNIFTNWKLLSNSFSHYWHLNDKTNIVNNHFYASPKDTTVSLHSILNKRN